VRRAAENPRRRRRRRARGEGASRLYLLPHLLTTGNLFFGFYAIAQAFLGKPDMSALGIVLAMVFDILDGRVARLTRSTSRFGGEYDSIADTVSFGVAPALLAFSAGNLAALGRPGWVMTFLFTACAALRLARFNVAPPRYRGRFEGLPSPAAAGIVATTQWFVSFLRESGSSFSVPEVVVAAGVSVLGLLMVSSIPYRSFKELDVRHPFGTLVLAVVALTLVAIEHSLTLFAVGIAYAFSGPCEWVWRRVTHRALEELPDAVAPESEPTRGTTS
jgi:CDP-diacylglycerol--serine O-phosphatidyltransferase